MQDPKTPSREAVPRAVKAQMSPRLYERCRREARQRCIQALKANDRELHAAVLSQPWPGQLVTQRRDDRQAWAGVKTPTAFVWLAAGSAQSVPSNDAFFAEALDQALARRRR